MRGKVIAFGLLWLPLLAWMGLIFFLSSQPHLPGPPQPLIDLVLKKGAHFVGYGILAVLWVRALAGARLWKRAEATADGEVSRLTPFVASTGIVLAALAATVMYAISDELHQGYVPGRHPGLADVVIDALGAATGIHLVRRRNGLLAWPIVRGTQTRPSCAGAGTHPAASLPTSDAGARIER